MGKPAAEMFAAWPEVLAFLRQADARGLRQEFILRIGMQEMIFDAHSSVLENNSGQVYARLITLRNSTQRYRAEQLLHNKLQEINELHDKVKELAERDSLTHAYTRRYLEDHLAELTRPNAETPPFSVALLDIDDFKKTNDHYGHRAGDQVLIALVEMINAQLGERDIVCRFGGEEFVIVLADTGLSHAVGKLENLREQFEQLALTGNPAGNTISAGFPNSHGTAERMRN